MKKNQKAPRTVDAVLYRHWQALYMSFYSSRLYVDVAKRWQGVGFFYLLLLIAIVTIPFSIHLMIYFNQYFDEKIVFPIESLPPFSIEKGQVLFDKPMPYIIKNKEGSIISVIDTTGTVTKIDKKYPDLIYLITQNKLYFRPAVTTLFDKSYVSPIKRDITEHVFKANDTFYFNAKVWFNYNHFQLLKWFVLVMIYPSVVAFTFGMGFSFMMVFAMMGQAFSWLIWKTKLTFPVAARLLIVASTPHFTIFMLLLSFNRLFQGIGIAFVGLWASYFSYAIISLKRESRSLVHA